MRLDPILLVSILALVISIIVLVTLFIYVRKLNKRAEVFNAQIQENELLLNNVQDSSTDKQIAFEQALKNASEQILENSKILSKSAVKTKPKIF